MPIIATLLAEFNLFIAIFPRVSGLILTGPIFNTRNIPRQVKIALTLLLSIFVLLSRESTFLLPPEVPLPIMLVSELAIGICIGFTANMVFSIIQLAGQHIDMQMGFGMVNVIDPSTGVQSPIMGTFKQLLAFLFYLTINGHHWLLEALSGSYRAIPLSGFYMSGGLASFMIDLTADLFLTGVKIAAPLFTALFITDFVMGIISRTVPQMNIFLVGMPLKVIVGFFFLLMVIPIYVYFLAALFDRSFQDVLMLIRILRGK